MQYESGAGKQTATKSKTSTIEIHVIKGMISTLTFEIYLLNVYIQHVLNDISLRFVYFHSNGTSS